MIRAVGMAVPAEKYLEAKGDIDVLRELAYWEGEDGSSRFLKKPEGHSANVVKKFHEAVVGPTKSPH